MIAQNEPIAGRAGTPLAGIETLCADFDEQSTKLETLIADLEADLETVRQKHLPLLKRQASVVARRQAATEAAIEAAPSLFVKPRTTVLHGIKVGLTSSEGQLVFDDAATVIKNIRKFQRSKADDLIRTKEEPNKEAIKLLPPEEQAALGCRIEGAGDVVICKRVAGDVEKLIKKLIEKLVEAMVSSD